MKNSVSLSADRITLGVSLMDIETCSLTMNMIRIDTLGNFDNFSFKFLEF